MLLKTVKTHPQCAQPTKQVSALTRISFTLLRHGDILAQF